MAASADPAARRQQGLSRRPRAMERPRQDDLAEREERDGRGDVRRAEGQPSSQHEEGRERLRDLVEAEGLCMSRQPEPALGAAGGEVPGERRRRESEPVAGPPPGGGGELQWRHRRPQARDRSSRAQRRVVRRRPSGRGRWASRRGRQQRPRQDRRAIRDRQQDERPAEPGQVTRRVTVTHWITPGGGPAHRIRSQGWGIVGETGISAGVPGGTPTGSSSRGRTGETGIPAGSGTGTSGGSAGRAGAG